MEEQPNHELLENLANSILVGRGAAMDQISALREEYHSMEARVGKVADTSLSLAAEAEAQATKVTSEVAPLRENIKGLWHVSGSNMIRAPVLTALMQLNRDMVMLAVLWADDRDPRFIKALYDCFETSLEIQHTLAMMPIEMDFAGKLEIGQTCLRKADELGKRCLAEFRPKPPTERPTEIDIQP